MVLANPEANLVTRLDAIVIVGACTLVATFVPWTVLDALAGIRVSRETGLRGLEIHEPGMEAYPDFAKSVPQ